MVDYYYWERFWFIVSNILETIYGKFCYYWNLDLFSDKEFPTTFESIVKKILKLLYHVLAHIYHSHFKEIVLLSLHSHLNCIFAHFVLFNDKFKLIDDKEIEVLHDLAIALRLFPPLVSDQSVDPLTAMTPTIDSLGIDTSAHFSINSAIIDNNNGVITTQCRSISPLVEANDSKCLKFLDNERNINKLNDSNDKSDNRVALSALQVPFNQTNPSPNSPPNPFSADASSSQSNVSESRSSGRRSISASAILLSSSDPSIPTTISRRCNSDRTTGGSGRSTASSIYHRFDHHNRASIVAINTTQPLFAACGSSPFKFQWLNVLNDTQIDDKIVSNVLFVRIDAFAPLLLVIQLIALLVMIRMTYVVDLSSNCQTLYCH